MSDVHVQWFEMFLNGLCFYPKCSTHWQHICSNKPLEIHCLTQRVDWRANFVISVQPAEPQQPRTQRLNKHFMQEIDQSHYCFFPVLLKLKMCAFLALLICFSVSLSWAFLALAFSIFCVWWHFFPDIFSSFWLEYEQKHLTVSITSITDTPLGTVICRE